MAINYNDPYNQGIGAPDLGNINLGNVGQMPVNNMQTAGWLPTFLGGTTAEEDAQNAALEQIEGLRIDQMKGIPQGKTEVETQSIIDDLQYTNPDKLKKYQDIEKQIQDLKKQYPENINIQQAYLDNDFYNEYGYPKTAFNPISIGTGVYGMIKAGLSKKEIAKVLMKNKLQKEIGKKVKPVLTGILTDGKAAAAAPTSHAEARSTGGDYHGGEKSTVDGRTTDWGPNSAMIARGGLAQYAPRGSYFNGGLASLWPR